MAGDSSLGREMAQSGAREPGAPGPRAWARSEVALWVLVAVLAFALRLTALGAAPLGAGEAREAALAWRAATGRGMPSEAGYSPLLLAANAALFWLVGASDAAARLWPALCGGMLALTPLLLRRRLGGWGALAAGLCLAVSPTALVASRRVDGAVLAALGVMALIGGVARCLETGRRGWLVAAGLGLALAVASDSSAYGLLLGLAIAWLTVIWVQADQPWVERAWRAVAPHLWRVALLSLAAALALATGFGWNLTAVGVLGDLLLEWFARFDWTPAPAPMPVTLLVIYEPLLVGVGLGGLVWATARGQRLGLLLGLWAGIEALMLTFMISRQAVDVLWIVLPLALLCGIAAEAMVPVLREHRVWVSGTLYIGIVLILGAYVYVRLAQYGASGDPLELLLAVGALALPIPVALGGLALTLLMRAGNVVSSDEFTEMTSSIRAELRRALLVAAYVIGPVALLGATVSSAWRVAHARAGDSRELLVQDATAVEVRDLVATLEDRSWSEVGTAAGLPITLEAPRDSVLAWYLRDFSAVRRVDSLDGLGAEELDSAVVSQRRTWSGGGASYAGQDFALRRRWDSSYLQCGWQWPPCPQAVRWVLRREGPLPAADQWTVLWLRDEITVGGAD